MPADGRPTEGSQVSVVPESDSSDAPIDGTAETDGAAETEEYQDETAHFPTHRQSAPPAGAPAQVATLPLPKLRGRTRDGPLPRLR